METINQYQTLQNDIHALELGMSVDYSAIERIELQLEWLGSVDLSADAINLLKTTAGENDYMYGLEATDTFQEKVAKAIKAVYEAVMSLVKKITEWYSKFLNFDLILTKRRYNDLMKRYHTKLTANKDNEFKVKELDRILKDGQDTIGKQKRYNDVIRESKKTIQDMMSASENKKVKYTEEEVAAARVAMRESEFSYLGDIRDVMGITNDLRDFVNDTLLVGEESLSLFVMAMIRFKEIPDDKEVDKVYEDFARKIEGTSIDPDAKLVFGKSIYMFVSEDDEDPSVVMEVISNKDWKPGNGLKDPMSYDDFTRIDDELCEILSTNFADGYRDLVKSIDKNIDALEKAYENLQYAAKNPDYNDKTKQRIQYFLRGWRSLGSKTSKELSARTSLLRDITRLQKYMASNNVV